MWCLASSPTIRRCAFLSNNANNGAAVLNYSATPTFVSCTFSGNDARSGGGAMYNWDFADPTIVNCTFAANNADNAGGAIRSVVDSTGSVTNCILWGNTSPVGPEIRLETGSTLDVTYSDVQGGWVGAGNLDTDPLFMDPDGPDDVLGTPDDDLHLSASSPCIDTGTSSDAPADDLDGNARPEGLGYDMGAYEYQP